MALLLRAAALACCLAGARGVQSRLPSEELQLRKKPSIGVATRVFKGELPYLASFVQHYTKLGVDRVHLLVTREEDYSSVDVFVNESSFNVPIQLILTSFGWFENDRSVGQKFTEDYIIAVDADEYLMLPPADLVASHPDVDVFFLPWFIAPYDGFNEKLEAPPAGYPASTAKYMVRRSAVTQFGCHHPRELDCGSRACKELTTDTSLMHFSYRGLVDAAIKSCAKGGKTGDCEERFEADDIPGRMKSLAFVKVLGERYGEFRSPDKAWHVPKLFVNKTLEHDLMLDGFDFSKYDFKKMYAALKTTLSDADILRATVTLAKGTLVDKFYVALADKQVAFFKSLKHKSEKDLRKLFVEIHGETADSKWRTHVNHARRLMRGGNEVENLDS